MTLICESCSWLTCSRCCFLAPLTQIGFRVDVFVMWDLRQKALMIRRLWFVCVCQFAAELETISRSKRATSWTIKESRLHLPAHTHTKTTPDPHRRDDARRRKCLIVDPSCLCFPSSSRRRCNDWGHGQIFGPPGPPGAGGRLTAPGRLHGLQRWCAVAEVRTSSNTRGLPGECVQSRASPGQPDV